jgi:hypothetical protein
VETRTYFQRVFFGGDFFLHTEILVKIRERERCICVFPTPNVDRPVWCCDRIGGKRGRY